eukprot:247475_1
MASFPSFMSSSLLRAGSSGVCRCTCQPQKVAPPRLGALPPSRSLLSPAHPVLFSHSTEPTAGGPFKESRPQAAAESSGLFKESRPLEYAPHESKMWPQHVDARLLPQRDKFAPFEDPLSIPVQAGDPEDLPDLGVARRNSNLPILYERPPF